MSAKFLTAADVAKSPAFDPDAPAPPRYRAGSPFDALDIRPGRVVLCGGPPGAGKTALGLQITVGVLQNQPELRAVYACVEMSGADLLARIVARLAGVPVSHIADKTFAAGEKARVLKAVELHGAVLARLAFLDPPFTLDQLAAAADEFGATILVADYLQRLGHGKDLRESLDGLMSGVRRMALAGAAVVAISSVARQKGESGGSSYSGLNMASFRGSAELEFGADAAYLLSTEDGTATMNCVKNRFGKPADIHLRFDAEHQRFLPAALGAISAQSAAPSTGSKRSGWSRSCGRGGWARDRRVIGCAVPVVTRPPSGHGCPPATGHFAPVPADTGVRYPRMDQKGGTAGADRPYPHLERKILPIAAR